MSGKKGIVPILGGINDCKYPEELGQCLENKLHSYDPHRHTKYVKVFKKSKKKKRNARSCHETEMFCIMIPKDVYMH